MANVLVKLKNGSEGVKALVSITMMSLESLIETNPVAFYELVMKCRDVNHRFFGNTGEVLQKLSLVQTDGNVHDSIRNIVSSAVDGDGVDMTLGSPVK